MAITFLDNNDKTKLEQQISDNVHLVKTELQKQMSDNKIELEQQIANNADLIFDHFPTDDEIWALVPVNGVYNTYFNVREKYDVQSDSNSCRADQLTSYVLTSSWCENAIDYTKNGKNAYVVPTNQVFGEVLVTNYGIKPGKNHAESNSTIINSLINGDQLKYGSTLRFPVGHFYFSKPINDVNKRHFSIVGAVNASYKHQSICGTTWLHFENLNNGDSALTVHQCTLADFTVVGSPSQYDYNINRHDDPTDANVAKPEIIETNSIQACGIKATGNMIIRDIGIKNFYEGMSCNTSNMNITNISINKCHYGITVGCDIKLSNIFGSNVDTLIRLDGSLSSATGVRGDSVGNHLVEFLSGGNHTLTDLDADFCMNSIVHINGDISDLVINGIHGRSGVSHVYPTSGTEITAKDITADKTDEFGVISIAANKSLNGAIITTNQRFGGNNPFDHISGYCVPFVLLSAGRETTVNDIQFTVSAYGANCNTISDYNEWVKDRISSHSTKSNACSVKVDTVDGYVKYRKDNGIVYTVTEADDIYNQIDKSKFVLSGGAVTKINGIEPDDNGNVQLEESAPVEIDSIDKISQNDDKSTKYVLPDGYIYAWRKKVIPAGTPLFTNQLTNSLNPLNLTEKFVSEDGEGYIFKHRYTADSSGIKDEVITDIIELYNYYSSGLIPIKPNDVIRINQIGYNSGAGANQPLLCLFDVDSANNIVGSASVLYAGAGESLIQTKINEKKIAATVGSTRDDGMLYQYMVLSDVEIPVNYDALGWYVRDKDVRYCNFIFSRAISPEDIIITVNEEIKYTEKDEDEWFIYNTGETFIKPDYQALITDLTNRIIRLESLMGNNTLFGRVDSNNNIIITGLLAEGTYMLKYEFDDGSTQDIGEITIDSDNVEETPESGIIPIEWNRGYTVDYDNGDIEADDSYAISQYIEIIDDYNYMLSVYHSQHNSTFSSAKICYYDGNKSYLGYKTMWENHGNISGPIPQWDENGVASYFIVRLYTGDNNAHDSVDVECHTLTYVKRMISTIEIEWEQGIKLDKDTGTMTTVPTVSDVEIYTQCASQWITIEKGVTYTLNCAYSNWVGLSIMCYTDIGEYDDNGNAMKDGKSVFISSMKDVIKGLLSNTPAQSSDYTFTSSDLPEGTNAFRLRLSVPINKNSTLDSVIRNMGLEFTKEV